MRLPTAVADFDDFLPPQRTKESPRPTSTLLKPQTRKPTPKGHRRVHSMEIERIYDDEQLSKSKSIPESVLKNEKPINNTINPDIVITSPDKPIKQHNLTKTSSDESIDQKLQDTQIAKST